MLATGHLDEAMNTVYKWGLVSKPQHNPLVPLQQSAQAGHWELVQLMLEEGGRCVDVNTADSGGLTLIHYAAMNGQREAMEMMLRLRPEARLNQADKSGATPFFRAVASGQADTAKWMASRPDVDVNMANEDGGVPFEIAGKCPGLDEALVEREGFDPNAAGVSGNAIHILCKEGKRTSWRRSWTGSPSTGAAPTSTATPTCKSRPAADIWPPSSSCWKGAARTSALTSPTTAARRL